MCKRNDSGDMKTTVISWHNLIDKAKKRCGHVAMQKLSTSFLDETWTIISFYIQWILFLYFKLCLQIYYLGHKNSIPSKTYCNFNELWKFISYKYIVVSQIGHIYFLFRVLRHGLRCNIPASLASLSLYATQTSVLCNQVCIYNLYIHKGERNA